MEKENPKTQIKFEIPLYYSKKLYTNYLLMKNLEYRLTNTCLKDCIDLQENDLTQKEKDCLRVCERNIKHFFIVSSENYENLQKTHKIEPSKQVKRKTSTDEYE